jgi:uncharacterized protein (TIGR03435 family)
MLRLLTVLGALIPIAAGQTPAQPLAFEAASVKPVASPNSGDSNYHIATGSLTLENYTLRDCIGFAYEVNYNQVAGGPKWMNSDAYDIRAKAAGPAKDAELRLMLQSLLAERFHLATHRESKTVQGYFLVVARNGLKIKPVDGAGHPSMQSHRGVIAVQATPLARLARNLAFTLRTPVVDATGVPGVFDFKLEWTPNSISPADADTGPSIFTALQRQLGLKLEPRKVPLDIIVVDRAEKPSEN